MTLQIEWRHLRGEDDRWVELVTRPTKAECMDYWSERVATYRRVLFLNVPFTCVCTFV